MKEIGLKTGKLKRMANETQMGFYLRMKKSLGISTRIQKNLEIVKLMGLQKMMGIEMRLEIVKRKGLSIKVLLQLSL